MRQHTKTLGQVFLHDHNIINKMLMLAKLPLNSSIIEIGCGKGILTKALSDKGYHVHVIEIDERWLMHVQAMELNNTTFEKADVLTVDFSKFSKSSIIANIPYHITSPLIVHLTRYKPMLESMTLMIQKEMAMRILAKKNKKLFGSMTLFCQYHFNIQHGFSVSRSCFFPVPNVDSYVLKFTPRTNILSDDDEALFFAMTRSFFWGRRKTMLNCLMNSPYLVCDQAIKKDSLLTKKLTRRGESLDLDDHLAFFDSIKQFIKLSKIGMKCVLD